MHTVITIDNILVATPTEAVKTRHEKGRYVKVWPPREEEKPVSAPATDGESMLQFTSHVSVAEQINRIQGVVDIEPFRYQCSPSVMAPGAAVVMDGGSGMYLIEERELQRREETWPAAHVVFAYSSKLTVAMVDG